MGNIEVEDRLRSIHAVRMRHGRTHHRDCGELESCVCGLEAVRDAAGRTLEALLADQGPDRRAS